ncbi:alpha/beta hydrolase [Streptomyces sp. NRRL S-87]|uniref:alpha/beta hydrolase n=1 Tax=Streptomyces sp. NRRL S-87 TaxID=1463920 RepID=UPI000D144C90|nr:alpha/beta hydrolase [Streptomyces sp. NRRL S-87]
MRRYAPLLAAGLFATTIPALAPAQAQAAGAPGYLTQKPAWHRCDSRSPAAYQCATIKVPLDYRHPEGRKIDLAISRVRSGNPAKRHGVLLLNPGGPGGSGLDLPLFLGDALPKKVKEQYDLVGFDPRGVGRSTPISCGLNDAEQRWDRPYKRETFARDTAWAKSVAAKCRATSGDLLPYITTRNTARDMDVVRSVLGERTISYLGYSYGTYLGAVYAQMFPTRTDRVVLDSAVDPARIWRGMIQVWASGAEPAYDRWAKWTAARNRTYKLGSTPAAVSKTFYGLVAQANRKPIPIDGQKLTGDDIRSYLRGAFFSPKSAAEAVVELKKAAAGQHVGAAALPVPPAPARTAAEAPADNGTAVFWAVACGDTRSWPKDPAQYRRDSIRDKARYPLYGDIASNILPCAFWGRNIEAETPMTGTAKVLTVQNEWDSQTPLASGKGLHRALKGSKMVLALGGEGHGVYLTPGSCANAPIDAYLTTGKLPKADITCRTTSSGQRNPLSDALPGPFPAAPNRF